MQKALIMWCLIFGVLCSYTQAQTQENNLPTINPNSALQFDLETKPSVAGGAYKRNVHLERIALPLEPIREADVAWSKRIWREIDTRQKINKAFVNEHQSFVEALLDVIKKHPEIPIFTDDSFTQEMSRAQLWQRLWQPDTIEVWNFKTEQYDKTLAENALNLETFHIHRLKEDWIFDSKSSKMRARIIGIAPIRNVLDPNSGQIRGQESLFWVHFESVRDALAKYEAFNDYNDAHSLSWTDVLEMRRFGSMIVKENNLHDVGIRDYKVGTEVRLQADKIHNKMRDFEFGLWTY